MPSLARPVAIIGMLALMALPTACVSSAGSPGETSAVERTAPDEGRPELAGTEWVLTSLGSREVPDDTDITLKVADDAPYTKFGGDAVCNSYGGRNVATEDGVMEINAVESTAVGCGAGSSVERTYFDALQDAATYRVRDDLLEIENAAGETILVFAREGRVRELPDSGGE